MSDAIQAPGGSASTIVDPSAQVSSAINTPHDGQSSSTKIESQVVGSSLHNYRLHSASPLDMRRQPARNQSPEPQWQQQQAAKDSKSLRDLGSSPLTARAHLTTLGSPHRATSAPKNEKTAVGARTANDSPFRQHGRDGQAAITAGSGFQGTRRFSIR